MQPHGEIAMTSTFETTLTKIIKQESAFDSRGEKAVENGVVQPLLRQIGWDTENISEIYPQHGLSDGGIVDYDLQIDGESRILIEVKRWAHILNDEDETQLANYCQSAKPRPKLAVLTSGRDWRLYLAPTASKGKNSVLKIFDEIDIIDAQPSEIESTFTQFLARNSMVDFKSTLKRANALYRKLQNYQEQKKLLTEAWNELSNDNNKLAKLVLELAEINDITTNPQNVMKFIESLDQSLVNNVSATSKSSNRRPPASFNLIASPSGKKKRNHPIKRHNGWNNCRLEICELMQERHPEKFRENLLSMPHLFSEVGDPKFLISDSGIYIIGIWTAEPARAACYATITKFGYSQDSLMIKDSKGTPL